MKMADQQSVPKPAGHALLTAVENAQLRKDIPEIQSGDTVRLQVRVVEGNRERLQPFEGVVMRLRGGGVNRNFTVRRITHGVGVERTFLLNSPRLEKIEVLRHARVRRKQLYYLRGLTGKAARLKELRPMTSQQAAAKEAARAARSSATQPITDTVPVVNTTPTETNTTSSGNEQ
jgi:large subunit ribosomal protein L19